MSNQEKPFAPAEPTSPLVGGPFIACLSDVLSRSSDLVLVGDTQGRLVWCNRAPSASARPGAEVASLFPPAFVEAMRDAQRTVLDDAVEQHVEWGTGEAAESRVWYFCAISPLVGSSVQPGFLSRSTDITELKRSEEVLRHNEALLVDAQGVAHLGTWEWDVTQPTVRWSGELYRIYGLEPATYTPTYEAYLTKVHPDDRPRVSGVIDEVFHRHVPFSHDERIFRPDGSMRYLHTWTRPVLDGEGRLLKLIGVCQDITDRRLAEDEVHKLNRELELRVADRTRQLESSLQDLESFNAMVSHDLKTPLTAIGLTCAVLEPLTKELPPRVGDCVRRIRGSTDRMNELIRDFLTLSRVGQVELAIERVDLGELAAEILRALRRAAQERRVDVHIGERLTCRGDPGLLRAALENLLSNAWKYTSKSPDPRIELDGVRGDGETVFYVRDNGVGFDMAQAGQLFQPFVRLHDPEEYSGTGVGLAAVRRIIVRHGGRVWADARPGQGATFFFALETGDA